MKRHRLNLGQRLDATCGQELGKQTDRREQLHVGIVESELNEYCSCSAVEPVSSMQLGDVALQVGQASTKVIDVATRLIGVMLAHEWVSVQLLRRLILKGTIDRCVGRLPAEIVPGGDERSLLLVTETVIVLAVDEVLLQIVRRLARLGLYAQLISG